MATRSITDRALGLGKLLVVIYFSIALLGYCHSTDSTDVGRHDRSGMSLYIDNLTGCHYLAGWTGVLVKRLDRTGRHVCTGQETRQ